MVNPNNEAIRLTRKTESAGYLMMKRIMDICGASIGLLLALPLFALVAILIKWEDPKGPVFFKQKRIGKNENPFMMFKFRSMVTDAEKLLDKLLEQNEVSGAMFKMKNDPRVTRIGAFIRKTSIDELPQLWNVLKGEMSLVGPRPPLQREVDEYTAYQKQRLTVTPGCTGLWQCGARNSVGFEEMVELDLQYIRTKSIKNDIMIILKTIKALTGSKNAF
ncbi:multidrug MFS transporter [Paenibacillus swuensis]|uniref:Multidrug MFS transporter n=1 Tax=Paenibacillus swuensis TaxID=1178515 RepID=A0A172TP30_9BACL|nr:sugar transferase [Paenibacillus swuensis]ANE48815.1 multidrug MFS transporter [Paenibacillus swuensis]